MYFASRNICSSSAGYGGLGAASIMPVVSFSCAGMSPALSATGWKPLALYHCTIRSSPWLVKSFAALMSASVVIGFFEKSCTQPALPQASSLKPLASRRFSSIGVSFSRTYWPSASDWKKNGMPKTLNASSIVPEARQHQQVGLQLIDAGPHHPDRGVLAALRAAGVDA